MSEVTEVDESFAEACDRVARETKQLILGALPSGLSPVILEQLVRAYPERGGKCLRPALCRWVCGLLGGDPHQARRIAAGIELFHTWTLVHDDIIDEDESRRGRPSAHILAEGSLAHPRSAKFGVDMALLAGDIQHGISASLVLASMYDGVPADVATSIAREMHVTLTPALIAGEALDTEFEYRAIDSVRAEEIQQMMRGKTGELLAYAARAGAMVALCCSDARAPRPNELAAMAMAAGMAFQLHDDILGMFGDPSLLGKPVGSDLRQGKRTLLIAEALERANEKDCAYLLTVLGQDGSDEALARVRDILEACGALAAVQEQAHEHVRVAREILERQPENSYRRLLNGWLTKVTDRVS